MRRHIYKATIEDELSFANDSVYFDQASTTEDSQVAPVEWKAMHYGDDSTSNAFVYSIEAAMRAASISFHVKSPFRT